MDKNKLIDKIKSKWMYKAKSAYLSYRDTQQIMDESSLIELINEIYEEED